MFLSDLSIRRPVFATAVMLTLVTLGVFSYRRLAVELYPDVEFPVLSVITPYPGASPEAVEREVTRKVEQAVNASSGVKHVYSTSLEGLSSVMVEFELEVRINDAVQDASSRLSAIRNQLPAESEAPVVQKFSADADPILSFAVRSDRLTPRELSTLADRQVKRRLESISGVGKVQLVGEVRREVGVHVDPARLDALAFGIDDLIAGLAGENVNTPLGQVTDGGQEVPLRVSGKPRDVPGYEAMVIGQRGGVPIALRDLAQVTDGVEEQRKLALVNGVPAVVVDVLKASKANAVTTVDAVYRELDQLRHELPSSVAIEVVRDGTVAIRDAVADVRNSLVWGAFLTVLIVFCFLNSWRSTVITGLALPISVMSSFIVMHFLGMTLNTMTLMALSLAIGLLIDDAIVVRENIVRHLEKGEDHVTAARKGTSEIGLAVLATTLSIVAVFVPVAFMKGIVGRFFFQFGITVAFAVLVSLFVSFTLDPMLSSRWVDPDVERKGKRHLLARGLDRFNDLFERMADRYRGLIGWALDHRRTVVAITTVAFAAGVACFGLLASEFMSSEDKNQLQITFKTAPDASFEETRGRVDAVLGILKGVPEVELTYASIGAGDAGTVRDAAVFVKLVDKARRRRSASALASEVRRRLAAVPGIVPSVGLEADAFGGKPITLSIRGEDLSVLRRYGAQLKAEARKIPGLVDVEVTMDTDLPEYRLQVDRRRAASLGLATPVLARTVSALVGGEAVTSYEDEEGEAVDVRVRLPPALRKDVSQVGNLHVVVPTGKGGKATLVPLSDLFHVERAITAPQISRTDLAREVQLTANLDGVALGTAAEQLQAAVARLPMLPGYRVVSAGDEERMDESFGYMLEALLLSVVLVYLILAAQFESFLEPLSIMFSLPLAIVGMAGMMLLARDTVSIMSLIGLIMLMGLVTKNAILLVDHAKVLRREGMERRAALIQAGRARLRPILMTTLAMIFGMVPLALGIGQGAEARAPMAHAVIGGLITSTALTLVVVPVVYSLLDDLKVWAGRRLGKQGSSGSAAVGAVTGALLVCLALPARAEDAPARRTLTLDEAIQIALDKNRDIAKARAYQDWVRGKYVEERAAALPSLSAQASVTATRDEATAKAAHGQQPPSTTVGDVGVTLAQALLTWGKTGAAVRAAHLAIDAASADLERFRQAVTRDVTEAFYDALYAHRIAEIAADTLAQRRRQLDEALHRYSLGTATDYDVLAARVALDNQQPEVLRAEGEVVLALDRLRLLLAEESADVDVAGSFDAEDAAVPSLAEASRTAQESRPDLQSLARAVDIRREAVAIAAAGDKPRLDLQAGAGWRWLEMGPGPASASGDGKTWSVGATLTFPFFDGLATSGRVQQAHSELATSKLDWAKARDAAEVEVHAALEQVRISAEIVRALSGTVDQARRLLVMAQKGSALGVKTRLEVDDALLNVRLAEANLAKARRDNVVARASLKFAQGTLTR